MSKNNELASAVVDGKTKNAEQPEMAQTQEINPQQTSNVEQVGTLSLLSDGFKFQFKIAEHDVVAWGSAKSGSENVALDGQIVSEKRSFSRRSVHTFEFEGNEYEIEFHTVSLLTGELHCTLIKNGVHVATQKQVAKYTADKKAAKWRIALWFVIGFGVGFLGVDTLFSLFDK